MVEELQIRFDDQQALAVGLLDQLVQMRGEPDAHDHHEISATRFGYRPKGDVGVEYALHQSNTEFSGVIVEAPRIEQALIETVRGFPELVELSAGISVGALLVVQIRAHEFDVGLAGFRMDQSRFGLIVGDRLIHRTHVFLENGEIAGPQLLRCFLGLTLSRHGLA